MDRGGLGLLRAEVMGMTQLGWQLEGQGPGSELEGGNYCSQRLWRECGESILVVEPETSS